MSVQSPLETDGYIDKAIQFIKEDGSWAVFVIGWMSHRRGVADKLFLGLSGQDLVLSERVQRSDVVTPWQHKHGTQNVGFEVTLSLPRPLQSSLELNFVATFPDETIFSGTLVLKSGVISLDADPRGIARDEISLLTSKRAQQFNSRNVLDRKESAAMEAFLASGLQINFAPSDEPVLSIILVLHNRAERTFACFESLSQAVLPQTEIICLDNASTDLTAELLAQIQGIQKIFNSENIHFIEAANKGAKLARGRILLFLNNDVELTKESIQAALVRLQSDPTIAVVGGRICHPDGSLQEAGSIVWADGNTSPYGRDESPFQSEFLFSRPIDYCSGSFLLTYRKEFLELGGFQERYRPAYYEDVDYCTRMISAGRKVVYEPAAVLYHAEHSSSARKEDVLLLQSQNREIFAKSHAEFLIGQYERKLENVDLARSPLRSGARILYIDDKLPMSETGAGAPRAVEILKILVQLGHQVTIYQTHRAEIDWRDVQRELPYNVEVLFGRSLRELPEFLEIEAGRFQCLWVSRPHNMQEISRFIERTGSKIKLPAIIYDVEAFYSIRELLKLQLESNVPLEPEFVESLISRETAIAAAAKRVLTVSEGEEQEFVLRGFSDVRRVAYGVDGRLSETTFEERRGLLTVSPIRELESPNGDGLSWFLNYIYPNILPLVPADQHRFSILGEIHCADFQIPKRPEVYFGGRVAELGGYYQLSRVFVVPTRYCSGIPLKLIEASAYGIPIVCSSVVGAQIGWEHGREILIASTSAEFSEYCAELLKNKQLWETLRRNAFQRQKEEFSAEKFQAAVEDSLRGIVEL